MFRRVTQANYYFNSRVASLPHRFVPRRYGSPKACEICGAALENEIHLDSREGRIHGRD
jgi:hypothetical protein